MRIPILLYKILFFFAKLLRISSRCRDQNAQEVVLFNTEMVERGRHLPSLPVFSNGDGWGDVKGIISRVDYLKKLGVDVLWTSPIYKSPQADMSYDISDYKAIDPIYGLVEDVDNLIAELKKRNMKLMMDLVVNHTSNQHDWFLESRSSKDNPKRH